MNDDQLPIDLHIETGEAGLIHATSPTHPGLFVSGHGLAEVLEAVPPVLTAMAEAEQSVER